MNTVKLIGNVGREVTVRELEKGKMATFSLATSETYMSRTNEEMTNTNWHNIVAWGPIAAICEELVEKGKLILVEGKITNRQYQNKEDVTVKITEIIAFKIEEVKKLQEEVS